MVIEDIHRGMHLDTPEAAMMCRAKSTDRKALEVLVYGITAQGEKVCQDHFFLREPSDLSTLFQLIRIRNIDVVRIVIDIALPVVEGT